VIIAYGQIIPARLLTLPRIGWINLHASLLPRYRGRPHSLGHCQRRDTTGLTTMQIDAGMDTGPTLLQHELEIGPDENISRARCADERNWRGLIVDSLLRLDRGEISPQRQDNGKASYAPILKKRMAGSIGHALRRRFTPHARFRAVARAYTTFRGQTCHVWGRPGSSAAAEGRVTPGEIVLRRKTCMWCVVKRPVCDWNPCNSRGVSESRHVSSPTVRASRMAKGLLGDECLASTQRY